jgi:putative transposase
MLKAYKYRIYPNQNQKIFFAKSFGCCRFIFNKALEYKKSSYESSKTNISLNTLNSSWLKEQKVNFPWLSEINSQALQQSIKHLDFSYKNFFRNHIGFPKFKNKYSKQSFSIPQFVTVDFKKSYVKIPKLGNILASIHRKFEGIIKTCTVSKTTTDKYFISILVDNNSPIPKKEKGTNYLGIDLGIKDFAIFSDGNKIENPKILKLYLGKISRFQQILSKKIKGSNNYNKIKRKIALLHEKISNKRDDFLHKLSSRIINNNHVICIEDLDVKTLLEKSNSVMARNIGDVSWSKFVTYLIYKAEWYGKKVVKVGRFFASTKICSECGEINNSLTLRDRIWECNNCKTKHDRDINSAINIKNEGLRIFGKGLPEFKNFEIQNFESIRSLRL